MGKILKANLISPLVPKGLDGKFHFNYHYLGAFVSCEILWGLCLIEKVFSFDRPMFSF